MRKSQSPEKEKKIVIVGVPNTGKSHIFNNLTGEYTLVGNNPFTTVEVKRGRGTINKEPCEIIDTPGLHCLFIHSEEELVVRDLLLSERPDVIIQCVDANRLKQSLTLTADLLALGIPMVICLNAIDETAKKGIWIDSGRLSHLLGVPVVESVAVDGRSSKELMNAVGKAGKIRWGVRYGDVIESCVSDIASQFPEKDPFKRKLAVLRLQNDPFLMAQIKRIYGEELAGKIDKAMDDVQGRINGNVSRLVNIKKNQWIDEVVEKVVRKQKLLLSSGGSEAFGRLSRHPVYGMPILLGITFIMYLLVVDVANVIAGWMEGTFWTPIEHSINAVLPAGFWNDFLIGDYGILSLGLANALLTVLPILSVFFLVFNILEDVGYIPNLSVLSKRLFKMIGLSGSAIMPLVLGFGCKTMATLTTKSLNSKRERYISIYLIAFAIPCAAQLGLNMSILGRMGAGAFIIAFSALAIVEMAAGLILNKILKEEPQSDFIQELPTMRLPNVKAVLKKTYYRLYWFLKEAVPVFLYAAVILFTIDKIGILNALKKLMHPMMEGFLGLPVQMVDALILTMARHEAAAALIIDLVEKGKLNYIQCIVAVTITTMFVPCFANIMAMIKELGTKSALMMVIIINGSAVLLAGALNWVLIALL